MREIIFPDINEIKGPPKIEKHGFITDHGAEMSLFVYKNRLMYMDVDNLRCIDYFTKEAFSPIADSKNTYSLSAFCENDIVYAFATKDNKHISPLSNNDKITQLSSFVLANLVYLY